MAKVRAKVEGVESLQRKLKMLSKIYPNSMRAAMYEEGLIIFANSQEEVPVDTGRLRASGMIALYPLTGQVIIGYGTDYAQRVHDDADMQARREQRQGEQIERAMGDADDPTSDAAWVSGGATQKWKYLEDPFWDAVPGLEARLMVRVRKLAKKTLVPVNGLRKRGSKK